MARFTLFGTTYNTASLDAISLKHLMLFNDQAEDMGMRRRWHDVERIAEEMDGMTSAEADRHPERLMMIGVTIWASRVIAGDPVTLEQAVDFPMSEITFIPDPEDRKPGKAKAAKKAAKKSTRTSAQAGSHPASERSDQATPTTPETPSTTD